MLRSPLEWKIKIRRVGLGSHLASLYFNNSKHLWKAYLNQLSLPITPVTEEGKKSKQNKKA